MLWGTAEPRYRVDEGRSRLERRESAGKADSEYDQGQQH